MPHCSGAVRRRLCSSPALPRTSFPPRPRHSRTPPRSILAHPHARHSCEGRNPEGRRAGHPHPKTQSHPQLPVVGPLPKSVRPEPVEGGPRTPTPPALADPHTPLVLPAHPHARHSCKGRNPKRECHAGSGRPFALREIEGWTGGRRPRGDGPGRGPPHHSPRHPDTASLPPPQSLRYRLPMKVAISANPTVARTVRIEAQSRRVKQQGGGVSSLQKNYWICS